MFVWGCAGLQNLSLFDWKCADVGKHHVLSETSKKKKERNQINDEINWNFVNQIKIILVNKHQVLLSVVMKHLAVHTQAFSFCTSQ